jgi:hypothetical protein
MNDSNPSSPIAKSRLSWIDHTYPGRKGGYGPASLPLFQLVEQRDNAPKQYPKKSCYEPRNDQYQDDGY